MLSPRENFIRFLKKEPYEYTPTSFDIMHFYPEEIPDNTARGLVMQQHPYTGEFGGRDLFGIEWIYQPESDGSIEKGHLFDLADLENWRDHVQFPDLDAIDWEGIAARNAQYLNTDKIIHTSIYTGFLERLYSFVGVEDAACALVDEELQDYVREIFDALSDYYIDYIKRLNRCFNVWLPELHDDWGTQKSTFMSPETHAKLITPYIRKICDALHREGLVYMQHSCGMIGTLLPNMIDAHIDTWNGQSCNDKHALVEQYGDRFRFCICMWPDPKLSSEDRIEYCKRYIDSYAGKDVWVQLGWTLTDAEKQVVYDYIKSKPNGRI